MPCPLLAPSIVRPDKYENRATCCGSQWYSEGTGLVEKYCSAFLHPISSCFHRGTLVLFFQAARPIGRRRSACHPSFMPRHQNSERTSLNGSSVASPARPGVGLALGGGFARGFAHLGVLQVLEQNQIPISHIAGTSVGSILGLASNQRLGALIERVFDSRQFEDLRIPLAVVATDLTSGGPVVFTQGNLVDAIRASCAFPGLFEPVEIGTRCLADGGLVAPVPTHAARELGASVVIGVSVGMQDGHRGAPTNIFQVVSRAVSAAQKHQLEIWERHADLVLRPDVQSLAWDDFHRAEEAIAAGASAALRALPRIEKLLGQQENATQHLQARLEAEDKSYLWLAEAH